MFKKLVTILFTYFICFSMQSATSADEILRKSIDKFFSSNGVEATYTVMTNNTSAKGIIKLQGNKFVIINSQISLWYDGTTQWSYNSTTNEITITEPNKDELNYFNPYNIIVNHKNNFTSSIVTSKIGGTYCVVLKPINKNYDFKKIVLYIKSSDYNLVRADLTDANNSIITMVLSNINNNQHYQNSEFSCPLDKYKKAIIIDLR